MPLHNTGGVENIQETSHVINRYKYIELPRLQSFNMSEKEPSFGLPKNWNEISAEERKLLQKPLIFPNHEKRFKIFTAVATFGEHAEANKTFEMYKCTD